MTMEELPDEAVGFLYKTMMERDPRKRRVKPVQHHLLQLDFAGLDDSSDDSDFQISDVKESTDSDDDELDDVGSSDEMDDESSSEVLSDNAKPQNKDNEETNITVNGINKLSTSDSNSQLPTASLASTKTSSSTVLSEGGTNCVDSPQNMTKMLICCVCLGEYSGEENEIVECDSCGVAVHEGCYGISDTQSVASTVSSASTEPWFCDACKAGVKPHCELCPNSGGIYKETDSSRWVHLVCALYVPGVAFGDVDKLSPVTLFEMSYSKWGARECSLCEDDNFSSTGVCICCDAGMCRTYFHVTCAQRQGLLSEASPDEDIADPFYAYCKQHADKAKAHIKHRNYLVIQSNLKREKDWSTLDDKERARVQRKLNRHRHKYQLAKAKRPPCWQPTEKMPRMLFSSPSATRKLLKKAQLLGIHTQTQTASLKDIRKKWHLPPAFSTEFVSYYYDRQERMIEMRKHNKDLLTERARLQQEGSELRVKYDELLAGYEELKKVGTTLMKEVETIYSQLHFFSDKPFEVPASLYPVQSSKVVSKKEETKSPPISTIINQCGVCHKTTNQHLLARCDTCKLYYHLGCLNPPLTRMPKKTRQMGWQCSECVGSASNDTDDPDVDPDAPRRLREKIKEPMKFTPSLNRIKERRRSEVTRDLAKKGSVKKKKDSTPIKMTPQTTLETTPQEPPKSVNETTEASPVTTDTTTNSNKSTKNGKQQQKSVECSVCMKAGDITNTVRCDSCTLDYHFQCLDPPQTKTPRYRGYAWFCTACQGRSDDNDDDQRYYYTSMDTPPTPPEEKKPTKKKEVKGKEKQSPKTIDKCSILHQMLASGRSPKQSSSADVKVDTKSLSKETKGSSKPLSVEVKTSSKPCGMDFSNEVIILDDDDDEEVKIEVKEKGKVQKTCPGSKSVTGQNVGKTSAANQGSEVKVSPKSGQGSRVKRPVTSSKSPKSKVSSDSSSAKRQKTDSS